MFFVDPWTFLTFLAFFLGIAAGIYSSLNKSSKLDWIKKVPFISRLVTAEKDGEQIGEELAAELKKLE
jgi:hypothetical protein